MKTAFTIGKARKPVSESASVDIEWKSGWVAIRFFLSHDSFLGNGFWLGEQIVNKTTALRLYSSMGLR
jgi:hypothetical protein